MLQIANSEMFCNYKPGSRKLGKEQMMLQFNQLEVTETLTTGQHGGRYDPQPVTRSSE